MAEVISLDEARTALDSEREYRRSLQAVVTRNPNGKLAHRASAALLNWERFDDWLAEFGGEDQAVSFVCAQVIEGVSLKTLCAHYVLDMGLLGALMTQRPEYEARLLAAQRWVAESHVSEMVGIADDVDENKMAIAKAALRLRARKDVAAVYYPAKFGDKAGAGVQVAANITIIHESQ